MTLSRPELWTLSQVKEYLDKEESKTSYFVEIPKFQRSIVWKDSQIRKLVDSIYKGFPIGALLAYKTERMHGSRSILQLVDGLQRATAIRRYLEAPLKYAPIEDFVTPDFLNQTAGILHGKNTPAIAQQVQSDLRAWFNSVTDLAMGANFSFAKLAAHLANGDEEKREKLVLANAQNGLGDILLGDVLSALKEVTTYQIPVSVYTGSLDNVPTIFERINSQGAQLSKYEILAASWSNTSVEVENPKVLQAIAEKYKKMIDNGYEIDGFDENGSPTESGNNLYEYLFGLGKVLAQQFPTLFHSADQADENSPVAFQIVTLACRLPVSKMGSLPDKMPKLDGQIVTSALESAILRAATCAEASLSKYLSLKLNEQISGPSGIKQNQAISYVTSFIANCFDENFAPKANIKEIENFIASAIPGHFLLDLVRDSWGGSGDSTLLDRTWESVLQEDANSSRKEVVYSPSSFYLKRASETSLREAFSVWHTSQLEAKQSQRVRYPSDYKPVLKFIYSTIVPFADNHGVDFELEHIYPVAVLKKVISANNLEGLPMAAMGNLMLLPKDLNRIKKENLLGDYLAENPESLTPAEKSRVQSYLISPKIEDISGDKTVSEDYFKEFCKSRAVAMMDHIASQLPLDD